MKTIVKISVLFLVVIVFTLAARFNLELVEESKQLRAELLQLEAQINDNYFVMKMDDSCSKQLRTSDILQLRIVNHDK